MQWICSLVLVDCFSPMARFGLQNFSVSWIRARDVVTNVARTETRVGRLGVCPVVAVMRPLQTLVGNKPPRLEADKVLYGFLVPICKGHRRPQPPPRRRRLRCTACPLAAHLHRRPRTGFRRRSKENPMTQQKSGYRQDYVQGTDTAKDRVHEMADATTDKVKDVAENAQEMAGKVADQARQYGEQAQEAVKQVRPFVEKSLKEQPMATLAGAAVLGFVLGALWKK